MNKIPCEIIQDLLPLYVDNVCNAKSRLYIEEHLATCAECHNYFASLKGEMPMLKKEIKNEMKNDYLQDSEIQFFKKLKKELNKTKYKLIALIVVMLIAFFGAFIFPKITSYPGNVSMSGKYLKAKNNTHILVGQYGYRIMNPQPDDLFNGLTDGDSIWLVTEGSALETKSGDSINVIRCAVTFEGTFDDLSELVVDELIELGYIDRPK